jgi:sugar/nucleoside kinase (ribokinase family)
MNPLLDQAQTYVVAGHVAIDEFHDGATRLGGTVLYAARTAVALGFSVELVTSCTEATGRRLAQEVDPGVVVSVAPSPIDTTFRFGPRPEDGPSSRVSTAAVLSDPSVLPGGDLCHLGPIAGEIAPSVCVAARATYPFLGVTAQGFLRRGETEVDRAEMRRSLQAVQDADVMVVSRAEYAKWGALVGTSSPRFAGLVAVTNGGAGAEILRDGRLEASYEPREPTPVPGDSAVGAGDVFAAALFLAVVAGLRRGDGVGARGSGQRSPSLTNVC